ncbi:acyltransferase family protein [Salipaludibacillus aurantiacus]|uniref:Membrane-bound acyltransferase YfiQ, involved in biofilm formation n=1 Tax=Salipaludibacillus aurantiacus TaxID=1601833 RepID=A0A1H9VQQ0_9BACI|nr:acyltransferase family protein [Salipaludibacillus aurantiacus]SES24096.1 Membrane-bound acyltransferase YfiQ, involved in biofilm formation [Salipaludibacillus aurantiacus]
MIKEIFILRSIGCLGIVLLHSIHIALTTVPIREMGELAAITFDSVQMILYYGTPMFIFISEFLISYSYRNRELPDNFLRKRFKFIMIPFIIMAVFYSLPYILEGPNSWFIKVSMNLLIGDYHGYFILIIFQFYIFHLLFHSYLKKASPKILLPAAFLINMAYLTTFNFTEPPAALPYSTYIWERFYWVPLFGWIFYFMLGYYSGLYYESFMRALKKYRYMIVAGPLLTSILLLYFYHSGFLTVHSSKRTDIIIHTAVFSLFLFYVTSHLKYPPKVLEFISRYSFGIYLLHYFYIFLADFIFRQYPLDIGVTYILLLFIFSLLSSIGTVFLLNKWKHGYLLIGKIGAPYVPPASAGNDHKSTSL